MLKGRVPLQIEQRKSAVNKRKSLAVRGKYCTAGGYRWAVIS